MTNRTPRSIAVAVCGFLTVILPFAGLVNAASAADAPAVDHRIKIGVLALHFEARGGPPSSAQRLDILKHFPSDTFDVRPIIDPDAEVDPVAQDIVQKAFGSAEPVDGNSATRLDALDVIVSPREWFVQPTVLSAIHQAVSDGVGLLDQTTIGMREPGLGDAKVLDLHGMSRATYFYYASSRGNVDCTRANDHALIEGMNDRLLTVRGLNGVIGEFRGTGLLEAPSLTDAYHAENLATVEPGAQPPTFYPLYVAQLGRGRIVGCQWYQPDAPPPLAKLKDDEFYRRCAKWLAEGRADARREAEKAAPATQPAAP